MSWKADGSGRKSRIRGSRCRPRSSRTTPRASSSSSMSESIPAPGSPAPRHFQGWPVTDFSMLSANPTARFYANRRLRLEAAAASELIMFGENPPNRSGARTHDEAFGGDAILAPADALQERAVGDPRRCENAVAARHVGDAVNPVEIIDPPAAGPTDLVVIAEEQLAENLAADATERRRRKHAFGSPAAAHVNVDIRVRIGGSHDPGNVAVGDQL